MDGAFATSISSRKHLCGMLDHRSNGSTDARATRGGGLCEPSIWQLARAACQVERGFESVRRLIDTVQRAQSVLGAHGLRRYRISHRGSGFARLTSIITPRDRAGR